MNKSSVIEILKHFSENDIAQFSDFVISPFFNKNKNVSKLYIELKKYYPDFDSDYLKKENIWNKIYPGKAFNYGVMKNLIHDLTKLFEEFVAVHLYKDTPQKQYFLLSGLLQRQIFNLYQKKYSYFEKKEGEAFKKHNSHLFYHTYSEINHVNLTYNVNDKFITNFSKAELKFIAYRIVYCLEMMARDFTDHIVLNTFKKQNNLKSDFTDVFFKFFKNDTIDEIITLMKEDFPKEHRVLFIHRKMFIAYMNLKSFKHYEEFKQSVFEAADYISKNDLKIMCYKLKNLVAILRHNNVNDGNFNAELCEIYDFMVQHKMHVRNNGTVPELEFNNYVTYLAEFKKTDKLENFIANFADKVTEINKRNSYNYGMANLFFLKGKYEQSLKFILMLSNDYERLKIAVRTLQVKCYYELNDYESFISLYNSFKKFDHKNNFGIEYHRKNLLNICRLVNEFFKIKNEPEGINLKLLEKKVKDISIEKIWLNEKIEELKV